MQARFGSAVPLVPVIPFLRLGARRTMLMPKMDQGERRGIAPCYFVSIYRIARVIDLFMKIYETPGTSYELSGKYFIKNAGRTFVKVTNTSRDVADCTARPFRPISLTSHENQTNIEGTLSIEGKYWSETIGRCRKNMRGHSVAHRASFANFRKFRVIVLPAIERRVRRIKYLANIAID